MSAPAFHPELQIQLERDSIHAFGAPFEIERPSHWRAPVIFASPHSGRIYPDSFLARSACDLTALRMNEDAYIDKLFGAAANIGAPLLRARFPRCFVDVNRAPTELPPSWESAAKIASGLPHKLTARARAGFGVIPLNISQNAPIYIEDLPEHTALERIARLYTPYHDALQSLIDASLARFGRAVLIDCHSMPGFASMGSRRADIVLGDRYGLSCSAGTITAIEDAFTRAGYHVVRNSPYAGGYVTTHYGRSAQDPQRAVETVQIEINRDLYQNPVTLKPKARHFEGLLKNLEDIIWQIVSGFETQDSLAAE